MTETRTENRLMDMIERLENQVEHASELLRRAVEQRCELLRAVAVIYHATKGIPRESARLIHERMSKTLKTIGVDPEEVQP